MSDVWTTAKSDSASSTPPMPLGPPGPNLRRTGGGVSIVLSTFVAGGASASAGRPAGRAHLDLDADLASDSATRGDTDIPDRAVGCQRVRLPVALARQQPVDNGGRSATVCASDSERIRSMPNTKSAERRMRSSVRKHLHNHALKSRLKTLEKKFLATLTAGKKDDAAEALRTLSSALDKAAKSGVIHANVVSRKKARLTVRLNALK